MAYECESKQTVVDVIKLTAIDVRQWYCTQKNPEYAPAKKGIRLKAEFVDQLLSAIEKCRE